jgi:hypothetical protein
VALSVYGTPVVSSDNQPVGTVREILGDDADDIFHGVRVHPVRRQTGRDGAIRRRRSLDSDSVRLDLAKANIDALPDYDETATYHLASVGWLRKHLGWQRDSQRDEEPG